MKRKWWIVLALAVLLATVWCGAAMAADELSFTQQPTIGDLNTEELYYTVTWATGFKPVAVEVMVYGTVTVDGVTTPAWVQDSYYSEDSSDSEMSKKFYLSPWDKEYKIRAYYYNSGYTFEDRYVESQPFTISNDHPALDFTQQPTIGDLNTEELYYPVTWATGFKPVAVKVMVYGTVTVDGVTSGAWVEDSYYSKDSTDSEMSKKFYPSAWDKEYKIRAYYYNSGYTFEDRYVDSQPFNLNIHNLSFDAGGGTGVISNVIIIGDEKYTLPECGFTWEDHVFDKWQIGTEYYQPGDQITLTGSFVTARATWKKYCTVTFNANGGTDSMASYNVTLLEGEQFTLPECAYTAPEGQRFRGYWKVSSELAGKRPGDVITVTKDTTISPLWSTIAYSTITFDMMSYGEQISPVTVEWGSVPPRPADPTASGMYFTGWYTSAYGASNSMAYYYYRGWDKPLSENVTLYAGWVTDQIWKLTLVYDEDAGQVSLSTYAAREGETVNVTINANEHYTYDYMSYGTMQSSQKSFTMPGKDIYVQVYFTCDHNHTASSMTFHEAVAPTCEEPGNYIYYICPICGRWAYEMPWTYGDTRFELISDHDRILIPALGHEYGVPAYEWAEDFSTVTATRVCVRDTSHIESEIVSVSAAVTKEPGPLSKGEHTYTSEEFENPAFSAQTFVLDDIDPLGIPVTEQFFPDSQFRSIAAQKDTDNNGYLSLAERNAVTLLNGTNKRIVTYEGIQYFPNLIELAGQNNTALEVLDVSMNPHLQRLTLNNSAKLTALDFSANPEMTYIQATNCGAATVNVANSPNLTYLNIIGNPVTNLDLSGNPLLETLYVYNSSLKELDLGSNPYILEACNGTYTAAGQYEQYVSGSYSLRAGKNTVIRNGDEMLINRASFPDESLRTYVENNFDTNENSWLTHVEINEANEIVLENAAELTSLEGIEYFTELDSLIVGDTPLLTSVDLSANTKIKNLDIYDTGLVSLNVSGLKLEFLGCVRSQLTSLTLGIQPNLWYLSCNGNPSISTLDISGAQHLIAAWLGTKDGSAAEYDRYTADGYILDVDKDTAIITGIPAPAFILPSALIAIETEAFQGIAAEAVLIPASVISISGDPFAGSSVRYIYGTTELARNFAEVNGYTFVPVRE